MKVYRDSGGKAPGTVNLGIKYGECSTLVILHSGKYPMVPIA
jgi:hypothetical protein